MKRIAALVVLSVAACGSSVESQGEQLALAAVPADPALEALVVPPPTTTTTTAAPPPPAPPPRPRATPQRASRSARRPAAGGSGVWAALARCESGGNPRAHSSNGRYHGAFQFSLATWRSLGYGGDPHEYPYEVQLAAAQRLQARSGWGQWPACARALGLL